MTLSDQLPIGESAHILRDRLADVGFMAQVELGWRK